ncbi:UDP-N-acetylmuramoyl-L-alanine--D-glutamate ligase [Streptomyces sp. A012304]|uniref:UDP-N-acetylmuramoyl-L-alanine--D-glutamate ligase n=1 Tax=Streptomyces sp. A012304 TaxID=375446 RepID=UPI00222F9973|nr:UDP-N-acetylmuramoyl-L-alanine--D-glutamate ligase [Streptomyces sp. A012304]GKQ39569.1 UDP-N-acetylmuramoylalanine--D-glutamate ligase [Streptomyces sp. A012304]
MLLNHANILVIGLGASGESAASRCAAQGARVTVTDTRNADELTAPLARLAALPGHPITYVLGTQPPDAAGFDLIVRSPGVLDDLPVLTSARTLSIPIWSEIELAYELCPSPVIAITGTNGKSTTTTLIGNLMRAAGRDTQVAGNIGLPFTSVLPDLTADSVAVIEVSAGQLENCHRFRPLTSVLTNVRAEHMNLYTWEHYVELKSRVVRHHTTLQNTVANHDDEICRRIAATTPGRVLYFSTRGELPEGVDGVFLSGDRITARTGSHRRTLARLGELRVRSATPNILATLAVGLLWDVGQEAMDTMIAEYTGREHVVEYVATLDGVEYYNDSKATNPWSVLHAVESFPDRPVVLITGGKDDKDADFDGLAAALTGRAAHVITIGETAPRITEAARLHGYTDVTPADSLQEALALARRTALPGQAVLFSPGANSKDMFTDHRRRGTLFKELVRASLPDAPQHPPVALAAGR